MNYVAIIGDIKSSKTINKRNQIQEKLNIILKHVNETYSPDIAAKFIITLGDEFQGLLKNYDHILDIAKYIQREMYPVNLRFGIGFGKIYTDIFCEAAIGSDGPAYYAAREMVKQLREQEKKLRKQTADIQISIYNAKSFEIVKINTILTLMKIIENGWSEKQRLTIWDMEINGGSQEECAKRLDTTQSTVARRLAGGNYLTYEHAGNVARKALIQLGELQK